jgi:very-short-patch-repair endonuclease
MAAKLSADSLDHAIRLYLAGHPLEKIPADAGVSISRLHTERKARGIPARSERNVPAEEIVAAYLAGASEYALSQQYGVSRGVITNRLKAAGIERRTMSEAGTVRNAQMSAAERKQQTAAANRGARMRRVPEIDKLRRAISIEAQGNHQSSGEQYLAEQLKSRGLTPTPQRAIGIHNVDLAVLPVAVEVLGGGWHSSKSTHAERTPYILDEGWHLIMVWDYEGRSALGPGAAEYIVAFLDEIRRNPPATCQYRVITGQGELLAASGRESNHFPLVPPPRGSL